MRIDRFYLCCWALALLPIGVLGLSEEEIEAEFSFAAELTRMGMSDYADRVVSKLVKVDPKLKERVKVLQALNLVAQRKYDDAEALLKGMNPKDPKVQAVNLQIANSYYARQMIAEAKTRYDAFFSGYGTDLPKDKDLLEAYVEAAWRQSTMLRDEGDYQGGITALNRVLSKNPAIERNVIRKLKLDAASLHVALAKTLAGKDKDKPRQDHLSKARKFADDVTFSDYDPLFMEAINTIVDIEITRGNLDEAIALINTYSGDLRTYEKQLIAAGREKDSPLAGLRFLRGTIYEQKANQLHQDGKKSAAIKAWVGAVKDYYNVFVQYPGSEWSIKAGLAFENTKTEFTAKTGKGLKLKLPKSGIKPPDDSLSKFAAANVLYQRRNYERAIPLYEAVLNRYPEVKAAPEAVRKLAISYIETGDNLSAMAVTGYLGERLGRMPNVDQQMLVVGNHFQKKDMQAETMWVYEKFTELFPENDQAPKILYLMAGSAKNAGKASEEARLLDVISKRYPDSKYAKRANLKTANAYFKAERWKEALDIYTPYVTSANPGFTLGDARFRQAYCMAQLQDITGALQAFNALKKDLAVTKDNPYLLGDFPEKIPRLQENVAYQFANTLTRVDKQLPNAEQFRAQGLKLYEQFVKDYPESELAPNAWYDKGFLLLEKGENAEAAKAFDVLSEKYPDTELGKNALYTLIRASFDAGQPESARAAVNKMLQNPQDYGAGEYIRVGNMVLEHKMFKETEECMQLVVKDPQVKDDTITQMALYGLAKSKHMNEKYEDCIKAARSMLKDYPNSAKFFELQFLIADCLLQQKKFSEAKAVHAKISELAAASKMKVVSMQNDLAISRLYAAEGNKQEAMAALGRITLFPNLNDEGQVSILRKAFPESIVLLKESKNWKELQATLKDYIDYFPKAEDIDSIKALKREIDLKVVGQDAAQGTSP